jgi:hypothetical protein
MRLCKLSRITQNNLPAKQSIVKNYCDKI